MPSIERRGGWLLGFGAVLLLGALLPVLLLSSLGALAVIGVFVGLLLAVAAVGASIFRNRTHEGLDSAAHAMQSPDRPVRDRPSPPRERSEREVRTGARHLATDPETEEARTLKQRLTEAVSDLADSVEEMPNKSTSEGRLTSEQMIARAKQRIEDLGSEL